MIFLGESDSQQLAQGPEIGRVLLVDLFFPDESFVTSNGVCIFGNTGIMKFQKKKHERFVLFIENHFKRFQFTMWRLTR